MAWCLHFSSGDRTIIPVNQTVVPWFVAFHLGARHKKHRIHGGVLPKVSSFTKALHLFNRRVCWRWFFRRSPSTLGLSLKRRPAPPPYCETADPNGVAHPPELRAWHRCMSREILYAARRCILYNSAKQWWIQRGLLQNCATEWLLTKLIAVPAR